ncbi:hypothetical protein E4T39_02346 [Aureobasidium subglaciale]|nr:hypothetical protein E4T39_02346 [Aureobasidium subglaciale]
MNKMESPAEDTVNKTRPEVEDLVDMWNMYMDRELNIIGTLNACQSNYDDTTFWQRDDRNGYHNFQLEDLAACLVARNNAITGATANNVVCNTVEEYDNEQQIAFNKLHAYISTKFSKETIQGTQRQKAARGGAATRRTNKAKRHEEHVLLIIHELAALRDYEGKHDEEYLMRYDRIIDEVMIAANVKIAPERPLLKPERKTV